MKSKHFADYFKWLAEQLRAAQQKTAPSYVYKIVGKEKCKKTGEEKLTVQVAGKNVFLQFTPKELVMDETMLKGFSPLDVRTITYLALQTDKPKQKKLFRIIAQFFSRQRKEEMFVIQADGDNAQITKSAQELSNDPHVIQNFDPQDAHRIGFIAGSEQVAAEEEELRKHRES